MSACLIIFCCTPTGVLMASSQVRYAEDHHVLDLREEERAAGCNHVEDSNRHIVCGWIDVHETISLDVDLKRIRGKPPQNIKRGCGADYQERQHSPTALDVRLEQQHT